uniref:DEAD/H box polypeptide 11 like 10 n=1 Tax=Homo sapiens TaxID=9606 RepID=B7ZGX5_HUMAN|nr:DEAD/H box polypeptide 11 like 10 [Homo sapiens]
MTIFRDPVSVTETFFVGDYSSHLQQLPLLTALLSSLSSQRNRSAGSFCPHCLGTNRGRRQSLTPRRLHPAQLEVLY